MLAGALLVVALAASWVQAQTLTQIDFAREVSVRLDGTEPWTWHGLPLGPAQALGIPYAIPADGAAACLATAEPLVLPEPAATVLVLFSPVVDPHIAQMGFVYGGVETRVPVSDAALVWAAEAPHSRKLLLLRQSAGDGAGVTEVRPHGCYVFAIATGDAAAATGPDLEAAYAEGRAAWQSLFDAEAPVALKLAGLMDALPAGSIALLPPVSAAPPALTALASETGLRRAVRRLTPAELVDPTALNAKDTPVAIYVGGESYIRSVRKQNDGATAVLRFLAEGGTLVLASLGPYPMFYAQDETSPGTAPVDPLLAKAGIDRVGGLERPEPGAQLIVRPVDGQTLFTGLPERWPFPMHVDTRLRSLGGLPDFACKVTPLIVVQHADGPIVGECAALFELGTPPGSRGTVLHIWGGLLSDHQVNEPVMDSMMRWIASRLGVSEEGGTP